MLTTADVVVSPLSSVALAVRVYEPTARPETFSE
jgi:hypothetical protein